MQGAVTVAGDALCVAVCVTSVMAANDEQKGEALSTLRIVLTTSTSARASRWARGMLRAETEVERSTTVQAEMSNRRILTGVFKLTSMHGRISAFWKGLKSAIYICIAGSVLLLIMPGDLASG